jgi:hypothetical protein
VGGWIAGEILVVFKDKGHYKGQNFDFKIHGFALVDVTTL